MSRAWAKIATDRDDDEGDDDDDGGDDGDDVADGDANDDELSRVATPNLSNAGVFKYTDRGIQRVFSLDASVSDFLWIP